MTKIFYFSGTGNSLWSARKIAHIIGEPWELYNIGIEAQKENIIIDAEAVVFVFPSYAYGMPVIVSRFIKRAVFKTSYIAAFVTFGSSPGGTLGSLRRILKKKKVEKMFFGRIPAVENYLALFGPPDAQMIKLRTAMQEKATEEAGRSIIEQKVNRVSAFYPFSAFVSRLFSLGIKIFYKKYKVSDKCDGCGTCEKICPVAAISMKNSRPEFSQKCEHCQGCINICPLRAIQFGRVKFDTPGYCHPQIKVADLER